MNEDGDNTTRFIVIEKEGAQRQPIAAAPGQRLSMLFTVDHKPGRLARVIQIIGERGFNMETIKSRPLPHVQFEYYFMFSLSARQMPQRTIAPSWCMAGKRVPHGADTGCI